MRAVLLLAGLAALVAAPLGIAQAQQSTAGYAYETPVAVSSPTTVRHVVVRALLPSDTEELISAGYLAQDYGGALATASSGQRVDHLLSTDAGLWVWLDQVGPVPTDVALFSGGPSTSVTPNRPRFVPGASSALTPDFAASSTISFTLEGLRLRPRSTGGDLLLLSETGFKGAVQTDGGVRWLQDGSEVADAGLGPTEALEGVDVSLSITSGQVSVFVDGAQRGAAVSYTGTPTTLALELAPSSTGASSFTLDRLTVTAGSETTAWDFAPPWLGETAPPAAGVWEPTQAADTGSGSLAWTISASHPSVTASPQPTRLNRPAILKGGSGQTTGPRLIPEVGSRSPIPDLAETRGWRWPWTILVNIMPAGWSDWLPPALFAGLLLLAVSLPMGLGVSAAVNPGFGILAGSMTAGVMTLTVPLPAGTLLYIGLGAFIAIASVQHPFERGA